MDDRILLLPNDLCPLEKTVLWMYDPSRSINQRVIDV